MAFSLPELNELRAIARSSDSRASRKAQSMLERLGAEAIKPGAYSAPITRNAMRREMNLPPLGEKPAIRREGNTLIVSAVGRAR